MILVIVESPSKAKTIEKYLGAGYRVLASVGHIRDLPKNNAMAIDVPAGFVPHYVVTPGKSEVISGIKTAAAKADEVLLATDPDREGEAIAWHIAEAVKLKKPKRVVFNEITKEAVLEAIANPREIDQNLRRAQEARRVLDRLVGYDLSGLIWKKVRYGLSAGRVQSPALRILSEREREIQAFIPERFFTIDALFKTKHGDEVTAHCSVEPKEEKEANDIVANSKNGTWKITAVEKSPAKRSPRAPFTTSTLQQAASSRLGFTPSRTMRVAQKLYEQGLITYMRTDSTTLAGQAVAALAAYIEKQYGKDQLEVRTYKTKSKNAQEAHEAIRPTDPSLKKAGSTEEEERLYALIHARTVASQMIDATTERTKITFETMDVPPFYANGSVIMVEGWLKADPGARGEDTILPAVSEGESPSLLSINSLEKFTEPPARYSEAGLIKELEKRGIGRPSTYASIIKTIVDREYVVKEGRSLRPTATGLLVSGFLEEHFATYISDSFTAEMEEELDQIANGEREYVKTLKDFYGPFTRDVNSKQDIPKITNLSDAPAQFKCPLCNSKMVMKLGRSGVFMSCSRFPECLGARKENGDEIKEAEPIGTHPETGMPVYVKDGKYGPYVEMPLEQPSEQEVASTKKKKPTKKKKLALRRASIPATMKPEEVTLKDAVKLLSLPRILGLHPDTGAEVTANTGKFGPYIVLSGDFRSLKGDDNPYTISFDRALEILKEPKKVRPGAPLPHREVGTHPRTKKKIIIYKAKSGYFLKKGFRRVMVPEKEVGSLTVADAITLLKNS